MRMFALFLVAIVASCSSSEVAHLPPYLANDASPGFIPGIADSGLIVPTIDTRILIPDTRKDSATIKRDTLADYALPDLTPGLGSSCDLLKQNCPIKSDACYPITGKGEASCQRAGGVGESGTCVLGSDPPLCDLGLTCVQGIMQGAVCLTLCDVYNSIDYCGFGSACQPLPLFTNVGYCLPG